MKPAPGRNIPRAVHLVLALWLGLASLSAGQPLQKAIPPGMAALPAGTYVPLFRGEKDSREIPVQSFLMDIFPVTNGDFLQFIRANPKWQRSSVKRLFADENYLRQWTSDLVIGEKVETNAPVTHVSWFAAKAYAAWKSKRLPTTAEWEYAAAASPTRPDGVNDPVFVGQLRTWYATHAPERLPTVGRGTANCYGLHDLHGLVWEWVADFNTAMVTGDARGDTGLERQLFCGSGSQGAKDTGNFPAFMRYGFRSSLKADYTVHNLGFRCVKDL